MLNPDYGAMIDLEEKAVSESEDCWTITGYGSVFGNKDFGNDVVIAGAFAKSLRENGMPLMLFNHKMDMPPIGAIIDAKEDKRGLWFKAELPKDDTFVAGQIVPQLKRRGLKGTSIGYKIAPGGKEVRKSDGARLLKEIRLFEISVVNMPMNPLASVETVKGLVPFQGLPIDRKATSFDAVAALARIKARFGDDHEEIKRAFIFADPDGELDTKLLIADIDEKGDLAANHIALYKASASVQKGSRIPEEAKDAVRDILERYYAQIDLESPFKSISVPEWKALEVGEREARLKGLGLANDLAKALATTQLGQREADRKSNERDVRSPEETALLSAANAFSDLVAAIKSTRK